MGDSRGATRRGFPEPAGPKREQGRTAGRRAVARRRAARGRSGGGVRRRLASPSVTVASAAASVTAARQQSEQRGEAEGSMGEHAYAHVPVMAGRIAALLLPALTGPTPGGRPPVLVDATLGRAGHARALLDAVPGLLLIGIDADAAAIEAGRALAERYPGRVTRRARVLRPHRRDRRRRRAPPRPGRPVRPRGLLAAARRRQPWVLLRPGRAARHAHGPERRS